MFRNKRKNKRKEIDKEKIKEKKSKLGLFHYLILASFFLVVAYVLFFSGFLKINNLSISGVEELNYEDIEGEVKRVLDDKLFELVEKNNLILISEKTIEDVLMSKFRRIEKVDIKKTFPDTILIDIKERKALLIWCSNEKCYFIDEKGIAYNEADFNSPEARENNLIIIRDEKGKQIHLEEKVIDQDYIFFLIEVKDLLRKKANINLKQEFKTPQAVSGDIRAETQEGWKIYLNKNIEAEKEVQMLEIVFDKNISEEMVKDLEYIDLRTENKVYYKFKQEEEKEGSEIGEEDKDEKDVVEEK